MKLILKKARESTTNEKPGAPPYRGWHSQEREQERHRLLDRFDESLKEGLRARSLNDREEQLDGAVSKGLEYLVCLQRQRAEILIEESKQVLQSAGIPKEAGTVELLLRIQNLATSAKQELDDTKPIPGRFVQPADKALERARQPLADAVAAASEAGLLSESRVLDGSESKELESLFSVAAKMLTVTRHLQPE